MAIQRTRDEVTYALFGMDPAAYYAERFHTSERVEPAAVAGVFQRTIIFQKTEFLLDELRRCGAGRAGFRVLDVGCGSGVFGAWVRHHFPRVELHGLDMSEACAEAARRHGYDDVRVADFLQGFPYPDGHFDFVFTMDVFGHIEFRSKDRVVAEAARVTAPGGHGFHGIEAGTVDYLGCDPADPEDPVRRYVWFEGHVGVETLEENAARFARALEVTAAFPWLVGGSFVAANVIEHKLWGEALTADMARADGFNSRVLADIFTARYNRTLLERLFGAFGRVLTRDRLEQAVGQGPALRFLEELLAGGGFAMIATRRPPQDRG